MLWGHGGNALGGTRSNAPCRILVRAHTTRSLIGAQRFQSRGLGPGTASHVNGAEWSMPLREFLQVIEKDGAGDGDRTRDVQLGKLAFYR